MGVDRDTFAGPMVHADQVIDHDAYYTAIALNPRAVMPTLVRALVGHAGDMVLIRNLPLSDIRHLDALTRLCTDPAIEAALTVILATDQAETLGEETAATTVEPERCASGWCDNYADPVYCATCDDSHPLVVAR